MASRPATYTVRPGDSLSAISARLFGSAGKWPYFYDANRRVVGGNPDMIIAGQVLQDRLGSHPAYGRTVVTTAASYPAAGHANYSGHHDQWDGRRYPGGCGDGDGDGRGDMPCSMLHHGGGAVAVSSGGYQARQRPGGYGSVSPGSY
jgi:hypothetical protein